MPIADPAKTRSHSITGTISDAATALQNFLQSLSAGSQVHGITTTRSKNSEGIIIVIAYELP
jgi:hypothetical protein